MTVYSSAHSRPWPTDAAASTAEMPALVARCLAGEERAYEALYDALAGYVYRLAFSLLQNREDAEEVLQDSFEYAFRRLALYDPQKAQFKTWLYRIVVSRCRNKRRRKWLPSFSLSHEAGEQIADGRTPGPDERLLLNGRQQRVWQALQQLSPKLRETAVLRYYEELSYPEIGAILDIPAKTAESRMRLAHKALRELLADEI